MKRVAAALSIFILLLVPLVLLPGCGGGRTSSAPAASVPEASAPTVSESEQEIVEDYADPETREAVLAAVRYAADANTGSKFKVDEARVVKGWGRVNVEQTGVPRDQAVTFDIYLRKAESGAWSVVETGTDLKAEDVPGAPSELFE